MSTCYVSHPSKFVGATENNTLASSSSLEKPELLCTYKASLPIEIWLNIFKYVAYIPGVFDISDRHAIEAYTEDENGIILHDLYQETMRTKLAISKVSWTWRLLILPRLFEYVTIRSGPHARVVAGALAQLKHKQKEGQYYGRWIKRIEVVLYGDYWEQGNIDALASVLEHSPNLVVFSDFFSSGRLSMHTTRGVVKQLHLLCETGKLRRIEWSGAVAFSQQELLWGCQSLEVFITRRMLLHRIYLPKLHTLAIGKLNTVFAFELESIEAPNLRNLIMRDIVLNPSTCYSHSHIASIFPKMNHLRCIRSDKETSFFDIIDTPGLTSLTLDFALRPALSDVKRLLIKHQSLERIDITGFPGFSSRMGPRYIEEQYLFSNFLQSLLNRDDNPSLRTIGFIQSQSFFDTNEHKRSLDYRICAANASFWVSFIAKCKDRGIKLETSIGAHDHFFGRWQPFHIGLLLQKPLSDLSRESEGFC